MDGYNAIQLGLVEGVKAQRINKPQGGHLKKAGVEGVKYLRELRLLPGDDDYKAGDRILVDQFAPNQKVDVIGTSKGKGLIHRPVRCAGPSGHCTGRSVGAWCRHG